MAEHRLTETARLELRAVDPERDLDALHAIWSDPASWWHAPEYRHPEPQTTRDWLESEAASWREDGLGYWSVRLRAGHTGSHTDSGTAAGDNGDIGASIGAGGARRHPAGFWNLLWRIDQAHQGHGYATELGRAALAAAHQVDEALPVIAWVLPINEASCRVAERLDLIEHEPRLNKDGKRRIPFADRPLEPLS
jgi:RimJ/RimL family protein N-acetyltransferase